MIKFSEMFDSVLLSDNERQALGSLKDRINIAKVLNGSDHDDTINSIMSNYESLAKLTDRVLTDKMKAAEVDTGSRVLCRMWNAVNDEILYTNNLISTLSTIKSGAAKTAIEEIGQVVDEITDILRNIESAQLIVGTWQDYWELKNNLTEKVQKP